MVDVIHAHMQANRFSHSYSLSSFLQPTVVMTEQNIVVELHHLPPNAVLRLVFRNNEVPPAAAAPPAEVAPAPAVTKIRARVRVSV
jgi:hypothetical protein